MEVKTRDSLVTFKTTGNRGKSAKVCNEQRNNKTFEVLAGRKNNVPKFGSNSLELICEEVLLLVDFQM